MASQQSYNSDAGAPGELEFENLVELQYAALYRFALSLARTEDEAGDLTQETFRIWAKKGHQLQDISKAKSWLFTTLHRLFLERQRRIKRFPHFELEEVAGELPVLGSEPASRLDAQQIVQLLDRIDPRLQAAVVLFYLEDYSYQEIANVLSIPLGTVKSRIARGLTQLKQLVRRWPHEVKLPEEKP